MKRLLAFLLTCFISLNVLVLPAQATDQPIKVYLDGEKIIFDIAPFIKDGTTLVQFRPLFEKLGLSVSWIGETRTVVGKKNGMIINLTIDAKTATANGNAMSLETSPSIVDGNTFVPLRFVGEVTGSKVTWDGDSRVIYIKSETISPSKAPETPITPAKTETPKTDSKVELPKQQDNALKIEEIGKFVDRVVYIEIYDQYGKATASGSGFVVSSDGKIVTNYHVIKDASEIRVTFSNKLIYQAKTILNQNEALDLALLKIETNSLPFVTLGDSSKVKLGETVVAIGSPLGLQNTLSTGVISSTIRNLDGTDYIQTTAPIDHGSSGGALFNMNGEVIGVTSAGLQSQASLNLAIPSNTLNAFINMPMQNIPVVRKPLMLNAADIQMQLNAKYSVFSGNGKTAYVSYEVAPGTASGGKNWIVLMNVNELSNVNNFLNVIDNNISKLDGFLKMIANDIYQNTNMDVGIGVYHMFTTSTMPSSTTGIRASEVSYQYGGNWQVNHNFYGGYFFYSLGTASYIFQPNSINPSKRNESLR